MVLERRRVENEKRHVAQDIARALLLGVVAAAPWLLLFVVRYVSGFAIPKLISAVAGAVWIGVFGYKMLKTASKLKGL